MATLPDDIPPGQRAVLALQVDVTLLQVLGMKARWFSRVHYGCGISSDMGGLPQRPGEKPRPDSDRVNELRWRMERFAEIIAWNRDMADRVFYGEDNLQLAVMMMRRETSQYEGAYGRILHSMDATAMARIDPTVDTAL